MRLPVGRSDAGVVGVSGGTLETPIRRLRLPASPPGVRTSATFACGAVNRPTGALTRVRVHTGVEGIDERALPRPGQPAQHVAEFADLALEPGSILRRHPSALRGPREHVDTLPRPRAARP